MMFTTTIFGINLMDLVILICVWLLGLIIVPSGLIMGYYESKKIWYENHPTDNRANTSETK